MGCGSAEMISDRSDSFSSLQFWGEWVGGRGEDRLLMAPPAGFYGNEFQSLHSSAGL